MLRDQAESINRLGLESGGNNYDIYQSFSADGIQYLPKRDAAQARQLNALRLAVFVLRPAFAPLATNHTAGKSASDYCEIQPNRCLAQAGA